MKVNVVFDGPPDPDGPRFIETEDPDGFGIKCGEWVDLGEGRWALQFDVVRPPAPADDPNRIVIGPLGFEKMEGPGMGVDNGEETLGYCEGVSRDMWDEFREASR